MVSRLSLSRLKQILRAHFKEKSATEIYQELAQLCQGPKESAQYFLIRAMNLRQQVIFSSQTVDSTVKYGPSLVQSLFIHVVETGLQQESIRTKLRPLLEKPNVNDEELMDRVLLAVSAETERQNKMGVLVKKSLHVNQINNSPDSGQEPQNPNMRKKIGNQEKECKSNKLVAALEAVQSGLASLKEAFNKSQISGKDSYKQDQISGASTREGVLCVRNVKSQVRRNAFIVISVVRQNISLGGVKAPRKRKEATPEGQGVAEQTHLSHACASCKRKETDILFKQCSKCNYCSKVCQEKHWGEHKSLCKELSHLKEQNIINREVNKGTYVCNLSSKEGATVARLVGKKCIVKCFLNGVESTALWDTGLQVSIVSHDWVLKNLPKAELRTVESLLGASELDLKAANETALPYDGWIDIDFKLVGTNHDYGIKVPFLVANNVLDLPIIGYNVIEGVTQNSTSDTEQPRYLDALSSSMVGVERDRV
jgi:hypothetical protein